MIEFDRITTRGGDSGKTSLADGSRRFKDDIFIETLGEIDELHAALGMLKASQESIRQRDELDWIERRLINLGGMIAVPLSSSGCKTITDIDETDIDTLERFQLDFMKKVNLPGRFITYGGSEAGARADVARAICRRTERRLVSLIRQQVMKHLFAAQRFINRLSDYLFVLARFYDFQEDEN